MIRLERGFCHLCCHGAHSSLGREAASGFGGQGGIFRGPQRLAALQEQGRCKHMYAEKLLISFQLRQDATP
ncbi:hypothetical protein WJX84_010274 [Apatococcus fuscideae]|uniref:Uncharacterized protein n=1 Tax=Apatococcus fuscideae TaxID=2026836 RepID=A0AAW1TBX1_9CHLO